MQPLLPNYLEQSLENFVQHQEDLREQMTKSLSGGMMPLQMMEEMTRQNMAMFQNTLNAFTGMTAKSKKDD